MFVYIFFRSTKTLFAFRRFLLFSFLSRNAEKAD